MQATHEYHKLLQRILDEGTVKENRTGIDTVSIFNHTLELDMNQGFPLITTKKKQLISITTKCLLQKMKINSEKTQKSENRF